MDALYNANDIRDGAECSMQLIENIPVLDKCLQFLLAHLEPALSLLARLESGYSFIE